MMRALTVIYIIWLREAKLAARERARIIATVAQPLIYLAILGRGITSGMRLTSAAFGAMTMELRKVAEECCEGRMVLMTEGGYDLRALAESLEAVVDSLAVSTPAPKWPASGVASDRGRATVSAAKRALAAYWKLG